MLANRSSDFLLRLLRESPSADDAALLAQFAAGRDEAAFEELMRRHGPMVLGVCRRVLGNSHDADDAFQVTFLVLAKKGRALTGWATVAGWLYRAACLTANKARVQAVRRKAQPSDGSCGGGDWGKTSGTLDGEDKTTPPSCRSRRSTCPLGR